MDGIIAVGDFFQQRVLDVAALLKDAAAPGLVSLALLVLLVIAMLRFRWQAVAQRNAIKWLTNLVMEKGSDFSINIDSLTATIEQKANTPQRRAVANAWQKYRETFVVYEENGEPIQRNSARPAQFLSAVDMGFNPGFWHIVPGLFVSTGLFLTFLGLVSALNSMAGPAGINSQTMTDLLSIASAKFIMSLTGLFCSIVFTVFMRRRLNRFDEALHKLCSVVENRLTFISLEGLAAEQLSAIREQREHFRLIGMELVAELGRPLREELPLAISNSVSGAIAPLLDRVEQTGVENINGMVKNLSEQFSDSVSVALTSASTQFTEAADKIGALSSRMDQSSGKMGLEMDTAVVRLSQAVEELRKTMTSAAVDAGGALSKGAEQMLAVMNQTLESIRDNTAEGARAISEAAKALVDGAAGIREEMTNAADEAGQLANQKIMQVVDAAGNSIDIAGRGVVNALEVTANDVSRFALAMSTRVELAPE